MDSHLFLKKINRIYWYVLIVWTLLFACAVSWDHYKELDETTSVAMAAAKMSVNNDLMYRSWVSSHGGVYVPVTDKTPPNIYLDGLVKERDITTPSGKKLTLVNPSYMTRQVFDISSGLGVRGHITSLKPIRPENAPKDWEAVALRSFEAGKNEYFNISSRSGIDYVQYMIPLRVESKCLKCHTTQGYKVGDIRGGLSVTMPLSLFADSNNHLGRMIVIQSFLWMLGVGFAYYGKSLITRSILSLIDKEKRYQSVVCSMGEGVFITSADGIITECNQKALDILGLKYDEFVGREVMESKWGAVKEDMTPFAPFDYPIVKTLATSEPCTEVIMGLTFSVPMIWLSINTMPIFKEGEGRVLDSAVSSFRDITQQKNNQDEKAVLHNQLLQSQKMESLGQLAGGIAHDFNNILQAINTYTFLIKMKANQKEMVTQFADEMQGAVRKGVDLSKSLLAFSRKNPLNLKLVLLNDIIADFANLLQRLLPQNIKFTTELTSEQVVITADNTCIQQILANLVTNSRDAMESGGNILLTTGKRVISKDAIFTSGIIPAGEYAVLSVTDTGHGIPADVIEKMFDPFFTTKEHGKGTGLGLSIVDGVVKQHCGFINVVSVESGGTSFDIYFPIAKG